MNPAPFTTAETRVLESSVIAADKLAAVAADYLVELGKAKAQLEQLGDQLFATLDPEVARDLAAAADRVRNLTTVCSAIEDRGGAATVRTNALTTAQNFATLEKIFGDRRAAIDARLAPLRKQLGAVRAARTEDGVHPFLIERDPEVARLRSQVDALDAAVRSAAQDATYARQWTAGDTKTTSRSFDEMFAAAVQPLPTT